MRLLHMRIEVAPLALRAPRSSAHAIAHTYLLREAVSVSPNPCQTVRLIGQLRVVERSSQTLMGGLVSQPTCWVWLRLRSVPEQLTQ